MHSTKLLLVMVLTLGLVGTAACATQTKDNGMSGAAVDGGEEPGGGEQPGGGERPGGEQPGSQPGAEKPGSEPGAEKPGGEPGSSGDNSDLMGALDTFQDSERLVADFVEKACNDGADCLSQLDQMKDYIETTCGASPSDCPARIANFTTEPRPDWRYPADLPVTFPSAGDVKQVAEDAVGGDTDTTGGNDLADALGEFKDSERLSKVFVEDACGNNGDCKDQLATVEDYIATDCAASPGDCPARIANFLVEPKPGQRTPADLGVSFPTAADVREVVEKALGGDSSDTPGSDVSPLIGALDTFDGSEHIAMKMVEDVCGADVDCTGDLETVETYIKTYCIRDSADCPADIQKFLDEPTDEEKSSGMQDYPTVDEVRDVVEEATKGG